MLVNKFKMRDDVLSSLLQPTYCIPTHHIPKVPPTHILYTKGASLPPAHVLYVQVLSFNLGGMGCSASVISVDLVRP